MKGLGAFGPIIFEVSDSRILTFKDMRKNKRARFSVINVANGEQRLQYDGKQLSEVTFTLPLHHRFCSPAKELEKLSKMVDEHAAHVLIVGGRVVGEFVLEGLGENWKTVAPNGLIMSAEGEVTLKEYK